MNPFDDRTPDEMELENQELITTLRHIYRKPVSLSSSQQAQLITHARERLLHEVQTVEDMQQSLLPLLPLPLSRPLPSRITSRREPAFIRVSSMIAAVLVVGAIIAASLLLFTRHPAPTNVGAPLASTPQAQKTCNIGIDEGLAYVCQHRLYQDLFLSQQQGNLTVTIEQAYADANRVAVAYTIKDGHLDVTETTPLNMTLATRQGMSFSGAGSAGNENGAVTWFYPSHAIGKPKTLDLRLAVQITGPPITFAFSLPFHAELQTISMNESVTANGLTLTLQKGSFSLSQARFSLTFKKNLPAKLPFIIRQPTLSLAHLTCSSSDSSINGEAYSVNMGCPLLNTPGNWTLTIMTTSFPGDKTGKKYEPWVFHFNVP